MSPGVGEVQKPQLLQVPVHQGSSSLSWIQVLQPRTTAVNDNYETVSVQTSDAQTSDQYKRRTGTFIRKNVGLGRFLMDHCFKKCQTMNSTSSYSLIPISLQPAVVDLRYFKL